jgi:hypothetical protein
MLLTPSPLPSTPSHTLSSLAPGGKGDDDILELPLGIEPACDDMCPATEAARRAAEMSLNFFEKNPRNPDDLRLAIKAFNRSCKWGRGGGGQGRLVPP